MIAASVIPFKRPASYGGAPSSIFHPGRPLEKLQEELRGCKLATLLRAHPIEGLHDVAGVLKYTSQQYGELTLRDSASDGSVLPIQGCKIGDIGFAYSEILRALDKNGLVGPNTATAVLAEKYLFPQTAEQIAKRIEQQDGEAAFEGAVYQYACDIEDEAIDWMIAKHFASGTIVLLSGDTGVGKSQAALHIVACVTAGKEFAPGVTVEPNCRGKAIVVSGEDSRSKVVNPRLRTAGADMSKVIVLEGFKTTEIKNNQKRKVIVPFSLEHARTMIEDVLKREPGVKLVIVDNINAFLGSKVEAYHNNECREILMPLVEMAEKRNLLLVLVHHNAKDKRGKTLTGMVGGSNAWVEAARSVWMCAKQYPDDPERPECVIEHIKSNYSAAGQRYAYTSDECNYVHKGREITTSKITISGYAERSIAQITRGDDGKSKLDEAKAFLRNALCDGAVLQKTVRDEARVLGISEKTLRRAREDLEVVPEKIKGEWHWKIAPPLSMPEVAGEDRCE